MGSLGSTGNGPGDAQVQLFYALNPTVGAGHVFAINSSGEYPSFTVEAFSGVSAYASTFSSAKGASITSLNSGSGITPTTNNCLVVGAFLNDAPIGGLGCNRHGYNRHQYGELYRLEEAE